MYSVCKQQISMVKIHICSVNTILSAGSNDFTENGCGDRLTLNIDTNPLFELGITFEDDNRLEGTEILEVQVALDDATRTAVNNSGNIFFQDTLRFSVADITGTVEQYYNEVCRENQHHASYL